MINSFNWPWPLTKERKFHNRPTSTKPIVLETLGGGSAHLIHSYSKQDLLNIKKNIRTCNYEVELRPTVIFFLSKYNYLYKWVTFSNCSTSSLT